MKRITFKQFLMTYNFRHYRDELVEKEDSTIIRIYPGPNYRRCFWFDFGVYNFGEKEFTYEIIKTIFNDNILNSYINDFGYNVNSDIIEIYLTDRSDEDEIQID